MLTLHQVEWCPFCHRVRQVMTELGLTYVTVNVPARREARADLLALSDQTTVPVLQDGDRVVVGSDDIIAYLRETCPTPGDAAHHAAFGRYRSAVTSSLAPRAALARLRELLGQKGFAVLAEVTGAQNGSRLPAGYTLLLVGVPAATAKALEADPAATAAVALPIAVSATEEGSLVAAPDPVGLVWLYGEATLLRLQQTVRERLDAVFREF